jgi:hypothetical protein
VGRLPCRTLTPDEGGAITMRAPLRAGAISRGR